MGISSKQNKEKSMNHKTAEHNSGASETARFFCTQISSAAGVAGAQQQHKKEPNMANKNTNPGSGKDDNEMRIQFGLILALCQNCAISHNPLFHAQNSNLFKDPRCFHSQKKGARHGQKKYQFMGGATSSLPASALTHPHPETAQTPKSSYSQK